MDLKEFISITKALSDSNRVRALMALRKGELCVCQIIELLNLAPSTISKHMTILKQAGLVESRKDSRWVYYSLADTNQSEKEIAKIIEMAVTLLKHDNEIRKDDKTLGAITCETLELLCKRQRKA